MSLPRNYVDGFLIEWEAGEYKAQLKSPRQASQAIVAAVPGPGGATGGGGAVSSIRAQAIRDRLSRTVRKAPEVMVKITSSSKGIRQIGRHIDYISRKGLIDIEDQDGLLVRGKEELKDLKADWRFGGPEEIGDLSDRRDTLNIVFSMPAYTDEVSMKRAVRAFAARAYDGHQYVFAYHTQATDPDPDPPAHPHVHLSVKVHGQTGRRLNPRKGDLQRWREDFAASLRAHGIDANATSRLARLKLNRGGKREVIAITERNETLHSIGRRGASSARAVRGRQLEKDRIAYYGLAAGVLAQSADPKDRALAEAMSEAFQPSFKRIANRDRSKHDLCERDV